MSALATEVQGQTAPEVSGQFQQVNTLWEEAVDSIFQVFSHVDLKTNYQIPEPLGFSGADSDDEQKNYEEYVTKYKKARDRTTQLSQHKSDLLNQLKAQNFKLLSDVGSMRAALLSRCDRMVGCERARGLTNANIENIAREIKVLPLRYMAGGLSKWLEIKAKFVSGVEGWLDISRQSLILIVLFLIPFFLIKLLNWSSQSIDTFRKNLLSRSMLDYRRRTQFAVWIARLNPFLPSVGMVIAVMVARSLLETTDLKEFSSLLFYAQIYFIYKTFRILLKIFLEVVFSTDSVDKIKEQKLRIEKSARSISRLIFIEYALLHFIEDTVRRALIYNLVQEFIFWLNVFFIFYETNKWRQEIKALLLIDFPH